MNNPVTSQTPRQRVLTALSHREPERVPFSWQFCATPEMGEFLATELGSRGISWAALRNATEDMTGVPLAYTGPREGGDGHWDIWGIKWQDVNYGTGTYREVAVPPLAGMDSVDALDAYTWPSPDWFDYEALNRLAEATDESTRNKAGKFFAFNPFETLCWMTGLEEALANCALQPDLVVRGLEHIVTFYEERLVRALDAGGRLIDIVFFADDLGTQNGPLMSRTMYREILQPFHRRLFAAAKGHAPHARVMFHSDGSVFDLIPDLLEAGIDILEAVQVDCVKMEPERLKATFGERLSSQGGISVQQLQPRCDAQTVEDECRRLVDVFANGGGYIAAPAHAIQMGTPVNNVLAMLRGVLGETCFARALAVAREKPDRYV